MGRPRTSKARDKTENKYVWGVDPTFCPITQSFLLHRPRSPPPVKRLRFRGDWSDTGPNARPEGAAATEGSSGEEGSAGTAERASEMEQEESGEGSGDNGKVFS